MRAWLLACAALALAGPQRAAAAAPPPPTTRHYPPDQHTIQHIKTQILAKLGLSSRPTPLGAPPRDVVRQILARAADPHAASDQLPDQNQEHSMREIIAIAHRDAK